MRTVAGADQPGPTLLRQERYPLPYFPPTMKARGLEIRNDHDAVGVLDQFLWNAFIGSRHDLREHHGGVVQSFGWLVILGQEWSYCHGCYKK